MKFPEAIRVGVPFMADLQTETATSGNGEIRIGRNIRKMHIKYDKRGPAKVSATLKNGKKRSWRLK